VEHRSSDGNIIARRKSENPLEIKRIFVNKLQKSICIHTLYVGTNNKTGLNILLISRDHT
jgi:hypothetical protein